jgi:hypothetical protein
LQRLLPRESGVLTSGDAKEFGLWVEAHLPPSITGKEFDQSTRRRQPKPRNTHVDQRVFDVQ